jgi:ABC-2 type transport system permease protein
MRYLRIKSVVIHAWHHLTHSVETWMDIFWFPMMQAFVFGGLALYFAKQGGQGSAELVVLGLLLWYGLEAGSYSIAVGALWEIWARNFSTLFVSPLTVGEFVAGHMIFGLLKQFLTVTLLSLVAFLTFRFSIFSLGMSLPVHFLLLMVFGWAVGIFAFGLILRFGTKIQSLAWGLVYIIQPLVGVYYPVDVLPGVIRNIAYGLPPTYVFASAQHTVATGAPRWDYLVIAGILNILYFALAYLFMKRAWEWGRRAGTLARMEQ